MEWTTTARIRRGLALVAGTIIFVYGCTDAPTDLGPEIDSGRLASTFEIRLDCAADIHTANFSCASASPSSAASSNLIVGGQDQFVRLVSESVTIEDGVFTAAVTVQNLSLQPLATLDGNTAVPSGLRVFFVNEPNNDVVVSNPSGTAPFIASQPSKYFLYEGPDLGDDGILDRGEVSAAKEWRFELNGATEFQFSVLISTHAPAPTAMGVHLTNLAAGYYHTCGEGNDGKVYCWGNSRYGALAAYPSPQFRSLLTPVPAPDGVTLSAPVPGKYRTCAYGSDGFVYCWGITSNGEFGHGENPPYPIIEPVQVPATIAGGVELSGHTAGNDHGCANGDDGAVYCWGYNQYGAASPGVGDLMVLSPTQVDASGIGGVNLSGVAAGSDFTCAIGSDDAVYCWGRNLSGKLGAGSWNEGIVGPVQVQQLAGVTPVMLALAENHACVLDDTGNAHCWGENGNGQLGDGTFTSSNAATPVDMSGLDGVKFTRIATRGSHTCADGDDGQIYCWGSNTYGEVGDGTTIDRGRPTPVKLDHLPGVQLSGVVAASGHTCASGSDGKTYCWGTNESGRLGIGSGEDSDWSSYSTIPIPVAATMAP